MSKLILYRWDNPIRRFTHWFRFSANNASAWWRFDKSLPNGWLLRPRWMTWIPTSEIRAYYFFVVPSDSAESAERMLQFTQTTLNSCMLLMVSLVGHTKGTSLGNVSKQMRIWPYKARPVRTNPEPSSRPKLTLPWNQSGKQTGHWDSPMFSKKSYPHIDIKRLTIPKFKTWPV